MEKEPQKKKFKKKKFKDRFYKWGFEICDRRYTQYGGHTQWLANLLVIDALSIGLCFKFGTYHTYYDGMHHIIYCGLISIYWMGRPYEKA